MKFRSVDCQRVPRPEWRVWDPDLPEGGFWFATETYRGTAYRTLWIRLPYDTGEREHSVHCIPVVHYERQAILDDDGNVIGMNEYPAPDAMPLPDGPRQTFWKWDGNEDRPTLWPSILARGKAVNNWHGFLEAGRLRACE